MGKSSAAAGTLVVTETRLLSVKSKPRCAGGSWLMKLTLDLSVMAVTFCLFCLVIRVWKEIIQPREIIDPTRITQLLLNGILKTWLRNREGGANKIWVRIQIKRFSLKVKKWKMWYFWTKLLTLSIRLHVPVLWNNNTQEVWLLLSRGRGSWRISHLSCNHFKIHFRI